MAAASGFWQARLCFNLTSKQAAPFLLYSESRFRFHLSWHVLSRNFVSSNQENESLPFIVSYLKNSFGLTLKSAAILSKHLHFETPERPNSVVNLFRGLGFTDAQISGIVRMNPLVLSYNPETLLPKFEFFRSLGCRDADVEVIFSRNPRLLTTSLEKRIVPCYDLLKSVLLVDSKVIRFFRCRFMKSGFDPELLASNIRVLRKLGIPLSAITYLLTSTPQMLLLKTSSLKETANEIASMGFNPVTSMFAKAIWARSSMTRQTWESKFEIYGRWGWSRDDTMAAFRKWQGVMCISEKKITRVMDFLVNKMGWQSQDVARSPYPFRHSLEERIIPRCTVAHVLRVKGLIDEDINLSSLLCTTDEYFLERYVTKFRRSVPQLLLLYEGKIGLTDLGIKPIGT